MRPDLRALAGRPTAGLETLRCSRPLSGALASCLLKLIGNLTYCLTGNETAYRRAGATVQGAKLDRELIGRFLILTRLVEPFED